MPTEQAPESLSELLVSLMPGGDFRSMLRDYMASALEQVAATDDLSLLRAAKGSDEFEIGSMEFVSNFSGVEVVPAPDSGFYGFMLGLLKLDRELRGEVLRAYAAKLRKSEGKCPAVAWRRATAAEVGWFLHRAPTRDLGSIVTLPSLHFT